MAMKCDFCGKGRMVGRQHRHHKGVAGGRWLKRAPKTQRIFLPNLHVARVVINGVKKKVKLCTRCLRKAKKPQEKIQKASETPQVATA
jgi:large subunit ribosomal protein L28